MAKNMTHAQQIDNLLCAMRANSGGYTEEELRVIFAVAKAIASFAAEAIVEITDGNDR